MTNKDVKNTNKDVKNTNEVKDSIIVVEGIIVEARHGKTRYSDELKNRVALKSETIPYDKITAFENVGPRLTPSWFKDKTGYLNVSSMYNIPVKDTKDKIIDFDDWISEYNALGSKVKMSLIQKEGALYPKAIKVIENGEERDPFEDL